MLPEVQKLQTSAGVPGTLPEDDQGKMDVDVVSQFSLPKTLRATTVQMIAYFLPVCPCDCSGTASHLSCKFCLSAC